MKYKEFDVYTGDGIQEGKKSLAYSLSFTSHDRTLTDEEINKTVEKIIERLQKDFICAEIGQAMYQRKEVLFLPV